MAFFEKRIIFYVKLFFTKISTDRCFRHYGLAGLEEIAGGGFQETG